MKETIGKIKPYHITWVTHNSRTSERMIKYQVKKSETLILSNEQEVEITSYIAQIVKEKKLKVAAYNICKDHVHILLFCEKNKLSNIVRLLKGKTTQLYKKKHNIEVKYSLWARKFYCSYIENNKSKFYNTIKYIKNNRQKHCLNDIPDLDTIIKDMLRIDLCKMSYEVE